MRRTWTAGVVAAVAASLWVAPAAQAAEAAHCVPGPHPEQNVVVIRPSGVEVNPGNAPGFVTGTADVYVEYAICLIRDVLGADGACLATLLENRPTVTVDPETFQVTIDYEDFIHSSC